VLLQLFGSKVSGGSSVEKTSVNLLLSWLGLGMRKGRRVVVVDDEVSSLPPSFRSQEVTFLGKRLDLSLREAWKKEKKHAESTKDRNFNRVCIAFRNMQEVDEHESKVAWILDLLLAACIHNPRAKLARQPSQLRPHCSNRIARLHQPHR
jgi:hypothetical protein